MSINLWSTEDYFFVLIKCQLVKNNVLVWVFPMILKSTTGLRPLPWEGLVLAGGLPSHKLHKHVQLRPASRCKLLVRMRGKNSYHLGQKTVFRRASKQEDLATSFSLAHIYCFCLWICSLP